MKVRPSRSSCPPAAKRRRRSHRRRRRASSPRVGNSATVLIVDDDPAARELLAANLKGAGYRLVHATSGDGGSESGAQDPSGCDYARRHDAEAGRLGCAEHAQGRPRALRHSGDHGHGRAGARHRPFARGRRGPDQACRPGAADGAAQPPRSPRWAGPDRRGRRRYPRYDGQYHRKNGFGRGGDRQRPLGFVLAGRPSAPGR